MAAIVAGVDSFQRETVARPELRPGRSPGEGTARWEMTPSYTVGCVRLDQSICGVSGDSGTTTPRCKKPAPRSGRLAGSRVVSGRPEGALEPRMLAHVYLRQGICCCCLIGFLFGFLIKGILWKVLSVYIVWF